MIFSATMIPDIDKKKEGFPSFFDKIQPFYLVGADFRVSIRKS